MEVNHVEDQGVLQVDILVVEDLVVLEVDLLAVVEVNHVEDQNVLQVDILVVEDLVAERFVRHVALLVELEVLRVEQCLPQTAVCILLVDVVVLDG